MDPFLAVKLNKVESVKTFIKMPGLSLNLVNKQGESLLDYAVSNKNAEIAKLLVSAGVKSVKTSKSSLQSLLTETTTSVAANKYGLKRMTRSINKKRQGDSKKRQNNSNQEGKARKKLRIILP